MASVQVQQESPRTAEATRLLEGAATELMRRYGRCTPFPVERVEVARAAFLVARDTDGNAVGCVVLRPFEEAPETTVEIKRMFVDADARGKGIGASLMQAIDEQARALGYTSIVLETGIYQPEAIRLYERHGYRRIPCWGEYADNPRSLCYEKRL